ncbi:hypothetical protein HRR83_001865 [Exophiala dermatitidis]|uniref:Protein kinase domain-containing protein n=2 Tax=Exophiala dermatitidis TaxID=5970 RepID=H6C7P6_EXODN|nr:uncharacterized protein HMPREF1120_06878 [Exophiala dermatitidis NIH/UT8656]KAJ4516531.1 hypothetical protein HRR73_004996 [Exophiala dermatitidis]EHY58876.1 hypothetical protein HMPREF1120_06878 [Exophiala dermatitidis NIH/UT8656]KAJ4523320.1 hypothetical protein HRR75_001721 [Exophiala dermatitidis]KAJ4526668.1 hypothetical protein HRR74_001868 [Exophiala dermatitidis]KAJ4532081.1 hypothetical protein HRR76_007082 [Exophiala dermatitidis]
MGITPHQAERTPLRPLDDEPHHSKSLFVGSGMWQKLHSLFAKDGPTRSPIECPEDEEWPRPWPDHDDHNKHQASSRPLAVGLPRQATFRRQNSEKRDRLVPVQPCHAEKRALSTTRRVPPSRSRPRAQSAPPFWQSARVSESDMAISGKAQSTTAGPRVDDFPGFGNRPEDTMEDMWPQDQYRPPRPLSVTSSDHSHFPHLNAVDDQINLNEELDRRWILNLSMHFRDKSDREKFFVTYAETPSHWRRVTISCDYRNAEPGSLEMDLKELQFQRDKNLQIYESIRDSLPDIQFYESVTNLKLETTDGRLHVHVTEDVNEIIPYPPRHTVAHILEDEEFHPFEVRESELEFDSHLSGFVYKVRHMGRVYIKKEIPGPDTVDEFLYEINALHALHDSAHVIQLEAIVLDDARQVVKGLLISFAEKGAVVDLLYDHRGSIPWEDRCRWAEHAVRGLSDIHEEGYVQGDFTLSNIVVDADGNAKIIDINRRGCPVGWEPPEIATKIASQQRISMYIGEKSDLYQLGMTLWALAMDDDEPERHVPPLSVEEFPSDVPDWYQDVVRTCLAPRPKDRLSAKELIEFFPSTSMGASQGHKRPALKPRTEKEYINPADAVGRDDIERLRLCQPGLQDLPYSPESSRDDYTFTWPKSSIYELGSEVSTYDGPRGRAPPANFGHLGRAERRHWLSEEGLPGSTDVPEPNIVVVSPGHEREFNEVELDGHQYLISRGTFSDDEMEILERGEDSRHDLENKGSVVDNITNSEDASPVHGELPPCRAAFPAMGSPTADSTPRNSHAALPTLDQPQLDTAKHMAATPDESERAPLNDDLDGHQEAPHAVSPASSMESLRSHTVEGGVEVRHSGRNSSPSQLESTNPPPQLCYADSGYDEPLGLVENEHSDTGALADLCPPEQFPVSTESACLARRQDQEQKPVVDNCVNLT